MAKYLDENGVKKLWETIKAAPAARIATGTYTGTDTYGADNPNVLNFEFVPKMVIVYSDDVGWLMPQSGYWSYGFLWTTGMPYALTRNGNGASGYGVQFTQEGNSLSWYIKGSSSTAAYQLNASDKTYSYFAIG